MRCVYLLACFLFPLLVVAQQQSTNSTQNQTSGSTVAPSNTASGSGGNAQPTAGNSSTNGTTPSPSVVTITSLSTGVMVNSQRILTTFTSTFLFTSTIQPSGAAGNNTGSGAATSAKSSSSLPPPTTAPSNIPTGGNLPGGAPSPGATAAGGVLGPNDGYIAGAAALSINYVLTAVACMAVGGVLVLA